MRLNGSALGTSLPEQKTKSTDKTLKRALKQFNASWDYAKQNYHQRWDDNWKLYHNVRTKFYHSGTVRTFVPMVNSSVNTLVAQLYNSNPSVSYIPNHPDQEQDTKVLNEIYADFARRDNWAQKNKVNGRQGIITGNICAYYEWAPDATGGYVHKHNVPVRDMVIDPSSHNYEDWSYVGRRFFAAISELKKETIYDFERDKQVKRYKNLDALSGTGGESSDESDKQKKDAAIGSTVPLNHDQVELIEIWTRKTVVTIANRQTVVEERENPHYTLDKSLFEQRKIDHELQIERQQQRKAEHDAERSYLLEATGEDIGEFDEEMLGEFTEEFDEDNAGLLPFAHGKNYEDISLPYGDSDVDIIADQQELLNNLTEMHIEALQYTINPERTLDPKYSTFNEDLEPAPGKVYPFPVGALNWMPAPSMPNNMYQERINIKDEIRESIAVSQVTKGVSASDDRTTATEIKAQIGMADARIQEKAQTLANDFFLQEARVVLKLIQLYAPDEMWVRTIDDAKADFTQVNPRKFLGEYTPMVTLDIQRRLEQAEDQDAWTNAYQIMIQDPSNNIAELKKIAYPKMFPGLTQEQLERIMAPASAEQSQETTQDGLVDVGYELPEMIAQTPEETAGQLPQESLMMEEQYG